MESVKCKYRGIVKTLMSSPSKVHSHHDFYIVKSACTHNMYTHEGNGALIDNPLVCIDCKLREEGD